MRIVSLLPSATEIVCALGFGEHLVGRSHECDFPPWVSELPVCSRPRIDIGTSSAALDQSVKAIVAKGLSVYEVQEETLRTLAPDVIVTQTQCEVCAVSERDVVEAVCRWVGGRPRIVSLAPNRLADVWHDISRVARELGNSAIAEAVVDGLERRVADIAAESAALAARPSVACIEWIEPLMAAGNWMPELVDLAGGRNLFGDTGAHSPWLGYEELVSADPNVILIAPCGFDIARTRAEMNALEREPRWQRLAAVRAGRVYVADGHQFFNRPGPRLVESIEILAEILHPQHFDFGHRDNAWMNL